MIDTYEHEATEKGLRCYVDEVAATLGLGPEACLCELGKTAGAYLALSVHMPTFPTRDFALLWTEQHGWATAVETGAGQQLIVLAYLGGDLLPDPDVVAEFVTKVLNDHHPGHLSAPVTHGRTDVRSRLGAMGRSGKADVEPLA